MKRIILGSAMATLLSGCWSTKTNYLYCTKDTSCQAYFSSASYCDLVTNECVVVDGGVADASARSDARTNDDAGDL